MGAKVVLYTFLFEKSENKGEMKNLLKDKCSNYGDAYFKVLLKKLFSLLKQD